MDLVHEPAEVAQHQLARAAQVAEPAAQPSAAAGRRLRGGRALVEPGGPVRVGRERGRRRHRQLGRLRLVARGRRLGRRAGALRRGGLLVGRRLAGTGGTRSLDASQESAHGRS
jgi:hypothetical protein